MGAYVPNPQDPTQPTTAQLAGNMAYELQALKGYIQSLVSSGTNFAYIGGFRNRLKNGSFRIAQRGTTVNLTAGAVGYTLDQWLISTVNSTATVNQGAGGVTANTKFIQIVPAAGNTILQLTNKIESADCLDLVAGTPITVSGFYLVTSLTAGLPAIWLDTPTAVDNWTAYTTVGATQSMVISPQITNTWQFFSNTFILSADATGGLAVIFDYAVGIPGQTVQFANIQLEKGSQYTQFEWRPLEVELAQCQRYYQTAPWSFGSYAGAAQSTMVATVTLPVAMRATPTVTKIGSNNSNSGFPNAPVLSPVFLGDTLVATAVGNFSGSYTAQLTAEL